MDKKTQETNPLICRMCGKPHLLDDNDAGLDREERRLCLSCFNLCDCQIFGYPVCYSCGMGCFSH